MMDLSGLSVLNTRPPESQSGLTELLESKGTEVVAMPSLSIEAPSLVDCYQKQILSLKDYDIMIVTSAYAAIPKLASIDFKMGGVDVYAVGPATKSALTKRGIHDVKLPKVYSSEGLLAMDELQSCSGKRVAVLSGEDPKPLLADMLRERGGEVEEVYVYRRAIPSYCVQSLLKVINSEVNVVVSTSLAGLKALYQLFFEHQRWFKSLTLVVVSKAMEQYARSQSHQGCILLSYSALDDDVLKAIIAWQDD